MRGKTRKKPHQFGICCCILAMLAVCSLVGCSLPWGNSGPDADTYDTGFVPDQPGIYDSADRAVFVKYDKKEQTLSFQSLQNDRRYTLGISGSTYFYDKYGVAVTADGLRSGQIVDLTFYKPKRRLNTLQVSPTAWVIENSGNFQIKEKTGIMSVGKDSYKLSDSLCIFSGEDEKELMDIASIDSLNIYGVDNEVYSISVTRGHGYLRLTGDEYFYGGWIEVGEKLIQKISENMLLTVPEGKSTVLISHKGISGTYSISRDEMKALIEKHGGKISSSVSARTSFLLAGEKPGPEKVKKAESLGVEIVNEARLREMLGGNDATEPAAGTAEGKEAEGIQLSLF